MKNLTVMFLIAVTVNVYAQDYTGIYDLKNANGSTGTLSVRKLDGNKYSFQIYVWWNLPSARHGTLNGEITLDAYDKGSYTAGEIKDDSCIVSIEFLGLGANVDYSKCESYNLIRDFTGYYLKSSPENPIFLGESRKYVVASKRSYFFHSFDAGAPTKVYIVKGDIVTVTEIKDVFGFAVFMNKDGRKKEGWLELKTLEEIK